MLCCKTVAVVPEALMPPITGCVLTSYSACRQEKNASFFASRCIFLRHGVTCCPRPVTRDAHKSLSPCCLRCVVSLRVPRPPAGKRRRKNEEARASIVPRWDAEDCPQLFSVFGPPSSVFRICAAVRVPSWSHRRGQLCHLFFGGPPWCCRDQSLGNAQQEHVVEVLGTTTDVRTHICF
jgi:hypothetical protein